MDPKSIVNATTETAKAANKFADIIERIKGPKWTRKQADADAYADEKKLQTIRNNPDMEIVYVDGQLNARERTPEALAFRAQQRQIADSIRKEENIENVLQFAANEITQMGDEPVSDAPVDDDWITRFFDIAEDIGAQDIQFIWGKILAGEIKHPGSFSLRTLDVLRNLSKPEAEAFQTIAPYILKSGSDGFIISDNDILDSFGIKYDLISLLDDCGLLISGALISYEFNFSNADVDTICNKKYLIELRNRVTPLHIDFGIYHLTKAGGELWSILDCPENKDYIIEFTKKHLMRKELDISIYAVNSIQDGTVCYEEKPIIVYPGGDT